MLEIENEPVIYTNYLLYLANQMINCKDLEGPNYGYLKCNYSGILRDAFVNYRHKIIESQKYCEKTLIDFIKIEFKNSKEGLSIDEYINYYTDSHAYGGNDSMNMYLSHNANISKLYKILKIEE